MLTSEPGRRVTALPTLPPELFWRSADRPLPFPFVDQRTQPTYFARNAIWHTVQALGLVPGSEVLVPAYHHGVEVEALEAAGLKLVFYGVDSRWQADLRGAAALGTSRTKILYLIHYAGFPQDVAAARRLCDDRGWLLFEDCALSLLSSAQGIPLGSSGDVSFFCLYKALPVPNGGAVRRNTDRVPAGLLPSGGEAGLEDPPFASTLSHLLGSLLGNLEVRGGKLTQVARQAVRSTGRAVLSTLGIRRVPVGSDHFDLAQVDLGISLVVDPLLRRIDCAEVIARRRRNYLELAERLGTLAPPLFADLEPGVCPLFYPTRLRLGAGRPSKAEVVAELRRRGIEAIDFWSEGHPSSRGLFPQVEQLRAEVLELPLHQDLGAGELDEVAAACQGVLHA